MTVDTFVEKMKNDIETFGQNMKKLAVTERSKKEWMETYLSWAEWTTDMKGLCWDDGTTPRNNNA